MIGAITYDVFAKVTLLLHSISGTNGMLSTQLLHPNRTSSFSFLFQTVKQHTFRMQRFTVVDKRQTGYPIIYCKY